MKSYKKQRKSEKDKAVLIKFYKNQKKLMLYMNKKKKNYKSRKWKRTQINIMKKFKKPSNQKKKVWLLKNKLLKLNILELKNLKSYKMLSYNLNQLIKMKSYKEQRKSEKDKAVLIKTINKLLKTRSMIKQSEYIFY